MDDKSIFERYLNKTKNRVVILPVRTYAAMQKTTESILEEEASSVIFYEMGIDAGRDSARNLLEDWNGNLLKLWDLSRPDGLGWFNLKDVEMDEDNGNGYIRLGKSFIAEEYGRSENPICHFLSGFFVGIFEEVLGERLYGKEIKCTARGDPYCEFRLERY